MFSVHKQILPPSIVDCCATLEFIQLGKLNLTTAQGNILTFYELIENGDPKKTRLRSVLQVKLEGKVCSMTSLKNPVAGSTDFLVLAFADAKATVIEYSREKHSIQTVSMHFYEYDKFKIVYERFSEPKIIADPADRCVVLNFYKDYFAIIPFVQNENFDNANDDNIKPPYLQSFVLHSLQIDPSMRNVIDVKFLHGYFEPTLAILFETNLTSTARLSVTKDTVSLAFVSLALAKRACPVINMVNNLPYDLNSLISIPKPLGGVLAAGVNCIMHFDQGSSGTGISLNGYFEQTSKVSLTSKSDLKLHFEGVRHCVLSTDTVLFSTREGNLHKLHLTKEGRFVSNFDVEKVDADITTLPSQMILLRPNYIFAAGYNGDSILYHFSNLSKAVSKDGRPLKRAKVAQQEVPDELDFLLDSAPVTVTSNEQPEHTEDAQEPASESDTSFKLTYCDRLLSLGPISDFAVGDAAYNSEHYSNLPLSKRAVEIVTCCGFRQQSSLCTVQKTIHPYIRSTFDIPDDTINMWTVYCGEEPSSEHDNLLPHHKFLLITKESKYRKAKSNLYTVVLQTGNQLNELDKSNFYSNGPTVYATSLFQNRRVLQVFSEGLRLLNHEGKQTQELLLKTIFSRQAREIVSWIKAADLGGPFAFLQLNDGTFVYLTVDEENMQLVMLDVPQHMKDIKPLHFCVYEDNSGIFQYLNETDMMEQDRKSKVSTSKKRRLYDIGADELDDFYGGERNDSFEEDTTHLHVKLDSSPKQKTFWFCLVSELGNFEIYSLPEFNLVYQALSFTTLPLILMDSNSQSSNFSESIVAHSLADFRVSSYGSKYFGIPCITAVSRSGDVAIYQCFGYKDAQSSNSRLPVRFSKVELPHVVNSNVEPAETGLESESFTEISLKMPQNRIIRPFSAMKGLTSLIDGTFLSGAFICGARPCLVFLNDRNIFRLHAMTIDGKISTWSSFHNVNCSLGFLYFTTFGSLRIAQLDRRFDYKESAAINKVMINDPEILGEFTENPDFFNNPDEYVENLNTVSKIDYHPDSRKYAVVSFKKSSYSAIKIPDPAVLLTTDENGDAVFQEPDINDPVFLSPDKFFPDGKFYSLDLYSPKTWQLVDRISFRKYENILCMEVVNLEVKVSGMLKLKPYIAVGTATVRGEDSSCRGKLYLYEVIDVVPKPGQPETNHKLKLVKAEDMRGIVASICTLNGYLCVGIGPKIMLFSFENGETLDGVAFLDTNIYVTCMKSLKTMLIFGDIRKSIWFTGYQEEPLSKINVLGKDWNTCTVNQLNLLIDENQVVFAVADNEGNLLFFSYNPTNMASMSGQKLLRKGDFNVGCQVSKLVRVSARSALITTSNDSKISKKQGCIYSAVDGSLGIVMPLNEKTYRRLQDIWMELASRIEHYANLNPREFRLLKTTEKFGSNPSRNVLDCDFVWKFSSQDSNERMKWARQRGTSTDKVIDDLVYIENTLDIL